MSARTELLDRLAHLSSAANLPQLIDVGIVASEHNGRANLLRKGLAIVAFNILEDFIQNKVAEALDFVASTPVAFSSLTQDLREASTMQALAAVLFRAKLEKKDGRDWMKLVQEEALKIHSTKNPTFALSRYSLVSSSSNVGDKEINELLSCFGIRGGWTTLKTVSDSIGGGLPDLNQSYKNAAERRHSSAHTAGFQYSHTWLANLQAEILAIAASLDIALTCRCRQIAATPSVSIDSHALTVGLKYRFLEETGSTFRETITIGGKSRKNWPSIQTAIAGIQPLLARRSEFLIVLDSGKRVSNWFS
ncbi:MAG: HEPN domain-containing protein [Arenimonas sp.]